MAKTKKNPKFDPLNCKKPIEGKIVMSMDVVFDNRIKFDEACNGEYIGHHLPDGTTVRPMICFLLEKDGKETVASSDAELRDLVGVEICSYDDSYYNI